VNITIEIIIIANIESKTVIITYMYTTYCENLHE